MILFQLGVVLILSKTITCFLTQNATGCNMDCHHGSCQLSANGHRYCSCSPGYFGVLCLLECSKDCHNGHCQLDKHGQMYCACSNGWIGRRCDQESCTLTSCGINGNCSSHGTCSCHPGFSGSHCEVDHCSPNPCRNGGECNRRYAFYTCTCHHHYTGFNCQVAPTTNTTPTLPTTTPATTPTTTLVPSFTTHCSKLEAVLDILETEIETSILAVPCPSGNHSSHEAFVLNTCHLGIPSTWKQGYNVMTFCEKIPPYTPIASFENGKYSSADSRSGIFIGCLHGPDGFKAAFQRCDEAAVFESITFGESMFNNNPYNYFTLEI